MSGANVNQKKDTAATSTAAAPAAVGAANAANPSPKEPPKLTTVIATKGKGDDETEEISYTDAKVIGNGSFGVVYQARLISNSELVAIKKVLQDRRYKVRDRPHFPLPSALHLFQPFHTLL